jgi:CRISPR-associated protein Cas5t
MRVLKITARGFTASFRYPHFMMGLQPTYNMPPPATLYGHVASALGEWFDPTGVRFALHFSYAHKQADIETTILLKESSGKMPQDKTLPKALEGNPNPFQREILFFPRLTLYINRPDWLEAFRHPRYAVCLGRSQDLFTYQSVEVVDLQPSPHAYLEHTLLPYEFVRLTASGQSVLMPRYLQNERKRQPTFERYITLSRRIETPSLLRFENNPLPELWADPTAPLINGLPLGLAFHSWV